jgi:hypothetical protein
MLSGLMPGESRQRNHWHLCPAGDSTPRIKQGDLTLLWQGDLTLLWPEGLVKESTPFRYRSPDVRSLWDIPEC